MDKRPEIIGRMFDRIAPTYDRLNIILSFGLDKAWRKKVINSLALKPAEHVLDIATGTGDMALLAYKQAPCRITGIDLSRSMLTYAWQKAHSRHLCHYNVVQGNAKQMPFEDATFDKAMVGFGIRNMDDLDALFKEVHRVLKIGGRFAILEFSLPVFTPFAWGHLFYLGRIVPFVGGIISGDFEAYRYLRDSVLSFPEPRTLEAMLAKHRLTVVQSQAIFFGTAHHYLVEKRP